MQLTLRNIKHSPSLSEETNAYTATVYKDGKPFCHVSNHGHGGCDMQHPIAPFTYDDIKAANAWCARNLPPIDMGKYGMEPLKQDLEGWCGQQLQDQLIAGDLRRALKSRVLFERDGRIYEMRIKGKRALQSQDVERISQSIRTKHADARILNGLPFDTALALYRKGA